MELPIRYTDGSVLTLYYRVDSHRAASVIPTDDFEPMQVFGKALIIVACFDYRQSTLGGYGELGVGVQVKRRGTSPSLLRWARDVREQPEQGIWVTNLPVTTEAARAAGVEQWGYPKYVSPMESTFDASGVRFRLGDELRIEQLQGAGLTVKGLPFVTFTAKDGRYLRTIVDTEHRVKHGGAATARILRLGDGPTAATMEKLGLFSTPAWAAQRTDALRAVLPLGTDVGAASAARAAA